MSVQIDMSKPKCLTNLKAVNINCKLNNLIITPLTCSAFIMEFIKLVIYEKLQIPYPYSWLKTRILKRQTSEIDDTKQRNMMVERQYNIAATAFQFVEDLSRQLHKEFKTKDSLVEEIVISFGATANNPKEAYCIKLPERTEGHTEANHISDINKTVNQMLRNLVLTQEWLQVTELQSMPPTNMHVLLRKRCKIQDTFEENDYFLPKDVFRIPGNSFKININFESTKIEKQLCCSYLQVFEDIKKGDHLKELNQELEGNQGNTSQFELDGEWFQSKSCMKGFKDTYVNKKSVSNLW